MTYRRGYMWNGLHGSNRASYFPISLLLSSVKGFCHRGCWRERQNDSLNSYVSRHYWKSFFSKVAFLSTVKSAKKINKNIHTGLFNLRLPLFVLFFTHCRSNHSKRSDHIWNIFFSSSEVLYLKSSLTECVLGRSTLTHIGALIIAYK